MELLEYQEQARQTAQYPNVGKNLKYPMLGLIGECGELTECIKKSIRDDGGLITEERKKKIIGELGDVVWYVSNLCSELKIDLKKDQIIYNELVCLYKDKNVDDIIFNLFQDISIVVTKSRFFVVTNKRELLSEISNLILYIMSTIEIFCEKINLSLQHVLDYNISKLKSRKERGVISGSGDNR